MTTPGIYTDIPMEDYIADPCPEPSLSKGIAATIVERSPMHAYHEHPRLGGRKDNGSSRADLGSAGHDELFRGGRVVFCDAVYKSGPRKGMIVEDWTATDARKFQREARSKGQIPMLQSDKPRLEAMMEIARPRLESFGPGDSEVTLIWKENGVWLRCRPDWVSKDRLVVTDYKTADNADPLTWVKRALFSGHYDLQNALALRGLTKLCGEAVREALWLVQEIEEPHAVSVIGMANEALELADRKLSAAVALWRQCLKSKQWPGYDERTHWAEVPAYLQMDWENRSACYFEQGVTP